MTIIRKLASYDYLRLRTRRKGLSLGWCARQCGFNWAKLEKFKVCSATRGAPGKLARSVKEFFSLL